MHLLTATKLQAANKNDLDSVLKDIDTLIPTKSTSTPPPTHHEIDSTTSGNGPVQTSSPHIGHTDTKVAPSRRFFFISPFIFYLCNSLCTFTCFCWFIHPTNRKFNLSLQANVIQIDIPPKVHIPTTTLVHSQFTHTQAHTLLTVITH